jgi:hypothetical protein
MPRLSNNEYLIRHQMLKRIWEHDRRQFSLLSYNQQRDLHDFFFLTEELDDEALLQKRSEITRLDPSLPHRASKAFLAMLRPKSQSQSVTSGKKNVRVLPLARPKVDVEMLAEALLDYVSQLPPEERDRLAEDSKNLRRGLGRNGKAA